jgi:hypothetical protein
MRQSSLLALLGGALVGVVDGLLPAAAPVRCGPRLPRPGPHLAVRRPSQPEAPGAPRRAAVTGQQWQRVPGCRAAAGEGADASAEDEGACESLEGGGSERRARCT